MVQHILLEAFAKRCPFHRGGVKVCVHGKKLGDVYFQCLRKDFNRLERRAPRTSLDMQEKWMGYLGLFRQASLSPTFSSPLCDNASTEAFFNCGICTYIHVYSIWYKI